MFKSERFTQAVTALVGAVILSTLSVGAAIGPVRAAEPGLRAEELAQRVKKQLGVVVHARSIKRRLAQEKKRR